MSSIGRVFSLLMTTVLVGCSTAQLQDRTANVSLPYEEISESTLYQTVERLSQEHNSLSGVYPLDAALDAFLARVLLIRAAEKTLDVQYYIWRKDNTGGMLMYELLLAAERGVRVRLLLDDLGSFGIDDWLGMMNEHPNIEVRLFNPFKSRRFRAFDFVTNFKRANRRMHNKSLTADQIMTIVGGRNVGDEYFAATDGILFSDLDVLSLGPVAGEVSQDFDRYWMSESSLPVDNVFKAKKSKNDVLRHISSTFSKPEAMLYVTALQNVYFTNGFNSKDLPFEWVDVRLVSDDPIKGIGLDDDSDLMLYRLEELLNIKIKKLDLVSPYFVPAKVGTETFVDLANNDAQIRVLTNALEATDVTAVHSGYMKRRKDLLEAGIEVYEMKNRPELADEGGSGTGVFGSSGSSLHAKTFSINNEQVFVGSFNFDPRSARLNTEMGFLIESPALADALDEVFTNRITEASYEVKLDEKGKLYWVEKGEPDIIYHKEPNTSIFKRSLVRFLSWLPLDRML